jgi:microcystin-dependent protein
MAQVANKDIANSSGAAVRADLNLALAAEASNNFGDKSQVGQVLPCEFVADNSTSPKKLLIRSTTGDDGTSGTTPTYFDVGNLDEANLGLVKRAGDTLTGPLLADDGSGASSPALSFDGDSDTGIYRSAANTMGFSTAGTQRVSISNAGLDMLNALPIRFQDSSGSPFVSLQSPSSLSGNVALTLPSSITNGGFLQTDGSGNLSFSIVEGVPTGSVFCLAVNTVPTGYVKCNGASYSTTGTYAALFAIIGTTYGGSGSSFNVPDLRGEFVRGFDDSRGVDSGRNINNPQGAQNASHNHSVSITTNTASLTGTASKISETFTTGSTSGTFGRASNQTGSFTPSGTDNSPTGTLTMDASHSHSVSGNTANQGGNEARPRNIAMLYIIKI